MQPFSLIGGWFQAKRAEADARRALAKMQESLYAGYGDLANRYVDTDRLFFGPAQGAVNQFGDHTVTLEQARSESRRLVRLNAHARNVVNQVVNFTVGAGFALKFDDDAVRDRWLLAAADMRWQKRRREIARRQVRDGEAIVRRFPKGGVGSNEATYRFVEPGRMATPSGKTDGEDKGLKQGVIFEPGDPESVRGYYIDGESVEAADVFTFRDPFSDMNDVRGWPLLYDAKPLIEQYERWVKTRAVLNELRAAIFGIRKFKGANPTQVQAALASAKAGDFTRPSGKSQRWMDKPLPGSVIELTDDIDLEFPAQHIGAMDAKADGRAMRLLIAVFFGFPEYWLTGDASNANFSSTLVAENPGVMAIKTWQEDFRDDIVRFIRWVLGDDTIALSVAFPNLVTRDLLKETQSRAVMHEHGALSRQTWMELSGLDPAKEVPQIEAEGGGGE